MGIEDFDHVIFASYGNDSIALIQWCREGNAPNVIVVHSDTGWAAPWWRERIAKCEEWVRSIGFGAHTIPSEGMIQLVKRKKGWPLPRKFQFCTEELKIRPAIAWLDEVDPDKELVCLVGVRREESRERVSWPEYIADSEKHGGRDLWSPLVQLKETERDALLERAGFEPLPHRSQECFPCINSNRNDLKRLTPERITEIEALEKELGFTSKGKPRTMFRPYRHMGATGIREVCKWAHSKRGKYEAPPVVLGSGVGCDSGMCGN